MSLQTGMLSRMHLMVVVLVGFVTFSVFGVSGCSKNDASPEDGDVTLDGDASEDGDAEASPDGDAPIDGDVDGDLDEDIEIPRFFTFAVISDTHIIDEFYVGPEGNELDTETIFLTKARMESARTAINAMSDPPVELVLIPGDVAHNYPSDDWDFYVENETRFDIAKQIIDGFDMPVYVGLGNHDYDIPRIPRDFTHRLVKEKWGIDPYYVVEYKGVKFIQLNNFLGDTMDPDSENYGDSIGSFGIGQLEWFEDQLSDGNPAFVFFHYPLLLEKHDESPDYDVQTILQRNENVKCVFSGHHHLWQDWNVGGTDMYGVPHFVIGSTRYDEDNILYVTFDRETGEWTMLNTACIGWGGQQANPYTPGESCEAPVSGE